MRLPTLAALALLAPLALLVASACDWSPPPQGAHLLWADGERALANRGYEWGLMPIYGESFEPVASQTPIPGVRAAASPDGAWLAFLDAASVGGACDLRDPRVVAALVATGERANVTAAEPGALAGGKDHLALSMRGAILLYGWGAWDAPARTLDAPWLARALAFSPDGSRLAASDGEGAVRVFDLRDGTSRDLDAAGATRLRALAFAPNGTYLAAHGGGGGGLPVHLRVWSLADDDPAPEAARDDGGLGHALGLAWGGAGIGATYGPSGGENATWRFRVFDGPALANPSFDSFFPDQKPSRTLLPTSDGEAFLLALRGEVTRVDVSGVGMPTAASPSAAGEDEPPSTRDAPLPWWLPLGALAFVSAARRPSRRRPRA